MKHFELAWGIVITAALMLIAGIVFTFAVGNAVEFLALHDSRNGSFPEFTLALWAAAKAGAFEFGSIVFLFGAFGIAWSSIEEYCDG